MRRYVRDEDGQMCDARDFQPNLTKTCMECGGDLDDYAEFGTPEQTCEECWAAIRAEEDALVED